MPREAEEGSSGLSLREQLQPQAELAAGDLRLERWPGAMAVGRLQLCCFSVAQGSGEQAGGLPGVQVR